MEDTAPRENQDKNGVQPPAKPTDPAARRDRRVKFIFLAVILAAVIAVYFIQISPPDRLAKLFPEANLPAALKRAHKENRPLLVFFIRGAPSETAQRLLKTTLRQPGNTKAIKKGRYICVRAVTKLDPKSPIAVQYKIKSLPTMLVLDSNGKELNRRCGFIGEVPFRNAFLNCKVVEKP